MKRRLPPRGPAWEEPPPPDGASLLSIFLSARQQADLHLPPFDVEGEALPDVASADDPAA